jgi:lipoprotein-anchoring transpeptidase ErfK/SrfK
MSRFSTSLLFRTGLSIVALLVTIPTQLRAEPQAASRLNTHSQTLLALEPPAQASDPVRATKTPQQPQRDLRSVPTSEPNLATPLKPTTANNPVPTVTPSPTTKPVAATNERPPIENVVNLVLKLKEKRVYVYQGEKLIKKYPVAIGKKGWETPLGEWQVMEKIKNPAWTSFKTGEVFAPGTENPLGARWIGFWTDGQDVIGFHGTANLKSIGTAASHGCVRMRNRDVKALFPLVKVGTTVKVVNE